jgi:hypothetical protein
MAGTAPAHPAACKPLQLFPAIKKAARKQLPFILLKQPPHQPITPSTNQPIN